VNDCAGAPLTGGYVLDALEPGEMDEMRRHVADCPRCGSEVRELEGLPGLLDQIGLADVPPPALAPEVEERVLDRFARERPRGKRARRPLLTPRRIAALGAACVAALVAALVLVWPSGDDGNRSYARARLAPPADASTRAIAVAYAWDVPAGTRVRLWARRLAARRGDVYELWCVRADGRWVSGGTFQPGDDGRAEAVLTAAVRPGDYHVMVVTRHRGGMPGPALLRGRLHY
jgi:hypothetical protein